VLNRGERIGLFKHFFTALLTGGTIRRAGRAVMGTIFRHFLSSFPMGS
jgi:hypothetical protein